MEGWKCPGCGKCFSPSVKECSTCGKEPPEAGLAPFVPPKPWPSDYYPPADLHRWWRIRGSGNITVTPDVGIQVIQ